MKPTVAAIQMTSGMDLEANLAQARDLLQIAADRGASLAVLPEMFPLLGQGPEFARAKEAIQEEPGRGRIQEFLAQEAARLSLWIIGGTIPLRSEDPHKSYASSLVFNAQGKQIARYDKIHLFDVELSAKESYRESDTNLPGSELVLVNTPVGKIGMSVCFDVRFPEMYRELHRQGAEILVIPSAFTLPTGRAHWEILVRARAIENFAYVIAAAQVGVHGQGRKTYGHSLIVAPTGEIIATQPANPGVIIAEINLALNLKRPCLPDH